MGVHQSHWINGRRYRKGAEKARQERRDAYKFLLDHGIPWPLRARAMDWSWHHIELLCGTSYMYSMGGGKTGKKAPKSAEVRSK